MNPSSLGRFKIIREIGRGAMGQVFLADDPKINRKVAIKTVSLPAGISPQEAQETSERFQREAQAAGKLLHPNIITIFDVGEDGGVPFIAMEYVEGETLAEHARPDTLLPPARIVELIAQAAGALDYAHENHVIHRDIKPANLMTLKDGTLKITDFGLAKSPSGHLTQSGVLLGTPCYMSPEQIQGKALDGRSDLFSLGVVLYELLTGVRPFDADSISTIIYRVLYEDPRPPAAFNPVLPPEINLILEKALAKAPEDRYPTGAVLVANLRKAFATLPPDSLTRPFPGVRPVMGPPAHRSPSTVRQKRGRGKPARRPGGPRGAGDVAVAEPKVAPFDGAPVPPTLLAHHPVKVLALVVLVLAGLIVFPRWVNQGDPRMASAPDGPPATEAIETALVPAAIGGAPDRRPEPEPGLEQAASLGQVAIDVQTIPHGGVIYLDSIRLAEPRIILSLADSGPHDITAQAGCLGAVAEMTASDLASFSGPLVLELQSRREEVTIDSEPQGALIRINGGNTRKRTPATFTLDVCEEQTVDLSLKGYRPWKRTFGSDDDFQQTLDALDSIVLEPIPTGRIVLSKPAEYNVSVYSGKTRLGSSGEPIVLTEGKHELTVRNDKLFVRETVTVSVTGGRTLRRALDLPALGSLTVQAQPSNCKVYVDGSYVDVTPLIEMPIGAGAHRVKVVFVPNGTTREFRADVEAGKNSRVSVKF